MIECMQIAIVVDLHDGEDPFHGDGYMTKGRFLQMQPDSSRTAITQQFLMAMSEYRYTPV